MVNWKYIIKGGVGTITTQNPWYAEQKSKSGYQVFCRRETNMYRHP